MPSSTCSRCHTGLLVADSFHDADSGYALPLLRCINCGDHHDPTIAENRIRGPLSPSEMQSEHRRGQRNKLTTI